MTETKQNRSHSVLSWLKDFIAIAFLTTLSYLLIAFDTSAIYYETGYQDWMVHAFRLKQLQQYGLSSWTHMWGNGISLWNAYQFVPHYITLGVQMLTHTSITQSMVLTEVGLFILFRLIMYFCLRYLGFSRVASTICTLMTFAISQYWEGVADFSLLFGFTFAPILIVLWTKYFSGKLSYIFPYIVGICFYIHPLLGLVGSCLWLLEVFLSSRTVISFKTFVQFVILLLASSLFWLPIVNKQSFYYSDPTLATVTFMQQSLSVFEYFGLSIFLILGMTGSLANFVIRDVRHTWLTPLFVFAIGYLLLVFLGLHIQLPYILGQLQFTRGVTFIGIMICFTTAPVIQYFLEKRWHLFYLIMSLLVVLLVIEGIWYSTSYAPASINRAPDDPFSVFAKQHPSMNLQAGRIWIEDIGDASYVAPSNVRLTYSYMDHLTPNVLPIRLSQLLIYNSDITDIPTTFLDKVNDYFQVTNTRYVFLHSDSPLVKALSNYNYTKVGTVSVHGAIFTVFTTPFPINDALLVDPALRSQFALFALPHDLTSLDNQIALDTAVHTFAQNLSAPNNQLVAITYPDPETISMTIPQGRTSNLVYVDESYDTNWTAYFNDHIEKVLPAGPNFMLITLDSSSQGGTLVLNHSWPLSFFVSIYFIALLPIAIAFYSLLVSAMTKKKRRVYA